MFAAHLEDVELMEGWAEEDPEVGFKFGLALSAATGSASNQVIYVSVDPGKRVGTHAHSAEELFLVLQGAAEVTRGDERKRFSASSMALIPAMMPHDALNVGSETLCFLAIFPSAPVLHMWEVPIRPMGRRMFLTPPSHAYLRHHQGRDMNDVMGFSGFA